MRIIVDKHEWINRISKTDVIVPDVDSVNDIINKLRQYSPDTHGEVIGIRKKCIEVNEEYVFSKF